MDFERIALLLNVYHMTLEIPRLRAIHKAAAAELEQIADNPVEEETYEAEDEE
jgi:hypothetical protein